jgi:hypothetical protein
MPTGFVDSLPYKPHQIQIGSLCGKKLGHVDMYKINPGCD